MFQEKISVIYVFLIFNYCYVLYYIKIFFIYYLFLGEYLVKIVYEMIQIEFNDDLLFDCI